MFWTVEETAEYLSVSQQFVYKLSDKGTLPSFRFGSCIRFDPEQVKEWVIKAQYRPEKKKERSILPSGSTSAIDRIIGNARRSAYNESRTDTSQKTRR